MLKFFESHLYVFHPANGLILADWLLVSSPIRPQARNRMELKSMARDLKSRSASGYFSPSTQLSLPRSNAWCIEAFSNNTHALGSFSKRISHALSTGFTDYAVIELIYSRCNR